MRCSGHQAGRPEPRAPGSPSARRRPVPGARSPTSPPPPGPRVPVIRVPGCGPGRCAGVGQRIVGKEVFDFMAFDVAAVRAAYPALADGYAYLDGAAGTQVPAAVIEAIGDAYRSGIGNAGGLFPASIRSATLTSECRSAVADLTGGGPDGVILGPNMTTLTYRQGETPPPGGGAGGG